MNNDKMISITLGLLLDRFIDDTLLDSFKYQFDTYIKMATNLIVYDLFNNKVVLSYIYDNYSNSINKIILESLDELGEAEFVHLSVNQSNKLNSDYTICFRTLFYLEDDSYKQLIDYSLSHPSFSILTPVPLYDISQKEEYDALARPIKSCRLIGCLINNDIYTKIGGIDLNFYSTGYEADYTTRSRLAGYEIILLQSATLRSQNYQIGEKKIFKQSFYYYETSPEELYYRMKNRYFHWNKYKGLDDEYIYLDQNIAKREIGEMKLKDPKFKELKKYIKMAKKDFKKGIMGKINFYERIK